MHIIYKLYYYLLGIVLHCRCVHTGPRYSEFAMNNNWFNRFTDIAAAIAYGHCIFLAAICLFFLCRRELEMRGILCQRIHLLRGSGVLSAGPERSAAGVCRKCGDGALWPGHQGNVRCPCRPKLGQKLSVCSQRVRKSDRVHINQGLV